jgi:hypothetical protein
VLALCGEAGLVKVGVIAIDGTKVHANASQHANRDYEQLAREILAEAADTDAREDEQFGDARGDELPAELSTAQGRRGWLRDAKRRLDEKRAGGAVGMAPDHRHAQSAEALASHHGPAARLRRWAEPAASVCARARRHHADPPKSRQRLCATASMHTDSWRSPTSL